ncbi:MAG: CRISPR-associated protein Cas4 [Ignavibacteriaceae bacterium]
MFEVLYKWNATRPDLDVEEFGSKVELRGYEVQNVGLNGEFLTQLGAGKIEPLSVGDIASKYCPTRRDLYFLKGQNKVRGTDKKTWARKAGKLVEEFFYSQLDIESTIKKGKYSFYKRKANAYFSKYFNSRDNQISKLKELEEESGKLGGDTDWLINMLKQTARSELILKVLNEKLRRYYNISRKNLFVEKELHPDIFTIGINTPAKPDFIIPKASIIGDIKTGKFFEKTYTLTCAGYALAYENEFKKPINWGAIFFFPIHTTSKYYRATTYPQVHFFPIDDSLRQWFLDERDEAYEMASKISAPSFPTEKKQCYFCKYKDKCITDGLILE